MGAALPPARRKRRERIGAGTRAFELLLLVSLLLLSAGIIWIFGGNRFWISGPGIAWLLLLGTAASFRYFIAPGRANFIFPPGGWVALFFLVFLAARIPYATIPYEARQAFFFYASYVAAYFLWINLLNVGNRWKAVLMVLMLSVSIMAWYALIQNSQGTAMVLNIPRPDDYGMRASGSFVCPNHFANILAMMTPLAIGVIAARGVGVPLKLFAGYAAVVSLPALYLTESRSGWIGLMAGIVVTSIALSFRKGWKRALMVMIVAPLLVVAAGAAVWYVSPKVQERVAKALAGDVRTYLWQDTMDMIKDAPWLGHGLASYRHYYAQYRDKLPFTHDPEFAHNDYLHFVAEIGIVGLLLAAFIPLLIAVKALPVTLARDDDVGPPLMAAMLGIMAAVFSHAVFDFNLHIFGVTHVLVLLLAALIAGAGSDRLCRTIHVEPVFYRWIGVGVAGVFLAGVVIFTPMLVSYYYEVVAEARMNEGQWERSEDHFRKAIAWQKDNWRARLGLAHSLRSRSFWMRNPAIRDPWIEEALALYESVERLNPVEHSVWYGQGSLYKMNGDHASALAKFQKTVDRIPRHIFYLNTLGLQLREMRRDEEALDVFRQSLAAEQNDLAQRNIAILNRRIRASQATGTP